MSEQEHVEAQPEELQFEVDYSVDGSDVKFKDGENPFADDLPVPEATQPEPEPPAEVTPPAEPEAAPAEEPAAEQPQPEAQELILGKYKDTDALIAAHQEQEKWATREAQRRAELERQVKEQEEFITKAAPILEQLQKAPEQPVQIDPYADPEVQEQQRQALIQQQINAGIAERMAAFEQQQKDAQVSAQQAEWDSVRQEFYTKHPEVQQDQTMGWAIRNVFETYGEDLPPSRENLEVAYQLVTRPQVRQTLDDLDLAPGPLEIQRVEEMLADQNLFRYVMSNPSTIEAKPDGWEYTKQLAGLPVTLNTASQTAQQAQQAQAQQAKTQAWVEHGTSGAPAEAAPGKRNEAWADIGGPLQDAEEKNPLGI